MKIFCSKCGKETFRNTGDYIYTESGLDNVLLRNIVINECTCGVVFPSIFRIGELNNLIADALIIKNGMLDGKEIRFLRKNLRFSAKKFSESIGIDNTTLSKWENCLQEHSEQNDRLIRLVYMILKSVDISRAQKVVYDLSSVRLPHCLEERTLIVELFDDQYRYHWQISGTTTNRVFLLEKKLFVSGATSTAGTLIDCSLYYNYSSFELNKLEVSVN